MAKPQQDRKPEPRPTPPMTPYLRRHLRFGWWMLLVFVTLGSVLEIMHGFKIDWYLNVANETRRLMWTLAHAHGVLLALVNLAFALTIRLCGEENLPWRRGVSYCLVGASILLPGGFVLGGVKVYGGDPSPGVLLVPVGAAMLFAAVLMTAMQVRAS